MDPRMKWGLLILNVFFLTIGACGSPLIIRLYFIHGGSRIWLESWLQTAAWPINFIPLLITYYHRRRKEGSSAKLVFMGGRVFILATIIGVLSGLDNYFYSYGLARLPASTATLVVASQLAFTALFAFLIVKQKFTAYSINAVFLLTLGAGILALHTSSDRPAGESKKEYDLGFFMTVAAAVLIGFLLPLVEWTYKKAKQAITYTLVLEIQLVLCFFATVFCTIGMVVNKDFQAISREARAFGLGETKYYIVLISCAIAGQAFFLGSIGVIFVGSSLLSGILLTVLVPVTTILSVIFFKESFTAEKGVSLTLALWGFVSYFYVDLKRSITRRATVPAPEIDIPPIATQSDRLLLTSVTTES